MAHGEQLDSGRSPGPGYWTLTLLLDQAVSAGEGPWVDVRGYRSLTIDVEGVRDAGTSVLIEGRTHVTSKGQALGVDLIDDGVFTVPTPVGWIRAVIPDHAPPVKKPVTVAVYAVV
jgi:hypothetical protein